MSSKLQPALLGGLLIGVLSALPFVSACCCLWIIVGGVLTTYLLQERSTTAVDTGDAVVAGLLAGLIGAVIATAVSQLIALARGMSFADGIDMLMGRGDLPPEISGALERVRDLPAAVFVVGSLVLSLVIYPIFSMLGALLGIALFRRTPPPPPPGTVEILPPE
jgi:hypothetical protein